MSDIFRKIGDTITETGKSVGEKTKQAGNVAKLNSRIISAERSVSDNYTVIGKYYYDKYKHDPDEEIAETVNAVTASIETIIQLKREILAIKGLVKCQNCGCECPYEDSFCGKCGARLEKPVPPAPAAEEKAEEAEEAVEEENAEEVVPEAESAPEPEDIREDDIVS